MTHLGLSPLSLFNWRYYFRFCVRQALSGTNHLLKSYWIGGNYWCQICEGRDHYDLKMLLGWHYRTSLEVQSPRIQWCLVDGIWCSVVPKDWWEPHKTAKMRVSPVQTQTIPRLELLGALLLAKLVVNVTSAEIILSEPKTLMKLQSRESVYQRWRSHRNPLTYS